jgi:hypothetical protein
VKIHVLALEGVFDTGVAAVLDAFGTANELAEAAGNATTRFDVTIVGVRRRVRTAQGFTVPAVPATRVAQPDVAIVPALGAKMPDTLGDALNRSDVADLGEFFGIGRAAPRC